MSKIASRSLILFILALTCSISYAGKKVVKLQVSEQDARVFLDGKLIGTGNTDVTVLSNSCVNVKIEKAGYLTESFIICDKPNYAPPPKNYYVEMKKDDAFDATDATGLTNIDIEVKTNKPEAEAWRLLSQIITSYFDVIEVTDKETGYLRTSWVLQSFKRNTIRTRIIVKLGSSDPLTYKIKLNSEQSEQAQTNVKNDELFKEYDRVLRKYKEIINEIQTRLTK
jgi:hypothetical protein